MNEFYQCKTFANIYLRSFYECEITVSKKVAVFFSCMNSAVEHMGPCMKNIMEGEEWL